MYSTKLLYNIVMLYATKTYYTHTISKKLIIYIYNTAK